MIEVMKQLWIQGCCLKRTIQGHWDNLKTGKCMKAGKESLLVGGYQIFAYSSLNMAKLILIFHSLLFCLRYQYLSRTATECNFVVKRPFTSFLFIFLSQGFPPVIYLKSTTKFIDIKSNQTLNHMTWDTVNRIEIIAEFFFLLLKMHGGVSWGDCFHSQDTNNTINQRWNGTNDDLWWLCKCISFKFKYHKTCNC